jgi:glycosyltransferase involved in cell wall biosynthesis
VISVTSEFAKNINIKNKHICYLLTPTRYLWSGYSEYFSNKILRILTKSMIIYLRKVDVEASKKPDELIAISTDVQKRIKKYYKRDSKIIFPPVSTSKLSSPIKFEIPRSRRSSWPELSNFISVQKGKYYLVVSRLVKYKRVDLAIEAFNELKIPLVIVGRGREEKNLKKIANKNIYFLGNIDDKKLGEIYKNAKGLIFPQYEDFGIVAVESQMYGTPVIAYKKGGSIDTVNAKTGIFFEKQTKDELIKAVKKFEEKKFNKKIIIDNAKRFSEKRFKEEFLKLTKSLLG